MKCSLKQFVTWLENLLVFHAIYKCGPPLFESESLPSNANKLLLAVRKLVLQIISYCPCEDRHKWKLLKLQGSALSFDDILLLPCRKH
jgi:hypothetical protein